MAVDRSGSRHWSGAGRRGWIAVAIVLAIAVAVPAMAKKRRAARPRIVNGLQTQDFPSTGLLIKDGSGSCTGTLIGCETFLTAAHCVAQTQNGQPVLDMDGKVVPLDKTRFRVFFQHAGFFTVTDIKIADWNPPVEDVAVLKISGQLPTPVGPSTGIFPSPLDTTNVGVCDDGTNDGTPCDSELDCTGNGTCVRHFMEDGELAGFGSIGNAGNNFGLKRHGDVEIVNCRNAATTNVENLTHICWDYPNGGGQPGPPGTDSNTCYGDSGGPLFIGDGCADPVAGITTAGTNVFCRPDDNAYDARVAEFLGFIQAEGGADLNNTMCGVVVGPQTVYNSHVEDGGTIVRKFSGLLDGNTTQVSHQLDVPPGAIELRVALNARDGTYGKCTKNQQTDIDTTDCALDSQCPGERCAFFRCANGTNHNNGAACINNAGCTGGGQCIAGICANGTNHNNGALCDHPSQCTGGGQCLPFCIDGTNDGTPCTNDGACTGGGICSNRPSNFDLYVNVGPNALPAGPGADVERTGPTPYEYYQKNDPVAGTWNAGVTRVDHDGEYQLTVTIIFPMKLHHFNCWETRPADFTPRLGVPLDDQFGHLVVDVKKPQMLCAPTDKNEEDCRAPADPDHLLFYRTRRRSDFTKRPNQLVYDQFHRTTPLQLDVLKPVGILVPTRKSVVEPPTSTAGAFLDHFNCYKVKRSKGAPKFLPLLGVEVEDQFGTFTIDLLKPKRLCAPVSKNGENPTAPSHPGHLVCYLTRSSGRLPSLPVFLKNQFGDYVYPLVNQRDICLPALKNPLPGSSGSPSGAFLDPVSGGFFDGA